MNLHGMAKAVTRVNPYIPISVRVSTGYTTLADGTQQPAYAPPMIVPGQVQPLSSQDLKRLEGLNIQEVTQKVYLTGDFEGVFRKLGKGGDLLVWNNVTYLVTAVLERWPDWVCVGVTAQND